MKTAPPPLNPLLIDRFENDYAFLSNFWLVPVRYPRGRAGVTYPSVEHAFQAAKATDPLAAEAVRLAATPGAAKRLGRHLVLRPDWSAVRIPIMGELLAAKFSAEPLRGQLLATEAATLIEGNTWHDQTWGQCRCPDHLTTPGRNLLGKLLMALRADLIRISPTSQVPE